MPTQSPPAEDDTTSDIDLEEDIPSDSEPDPELLSCHLEQLFEHSNDVRLHLSGALEDEDALDPSYFAPNTCWTTQEKNTFFHALSMYSRFRPDLIAEVIGTKSLADVCTYIEMLEEALHRDVEEFYPVPRDEFPTAYEVSEKWVEFEDDLAEAAIADEPEMRAQVFQRARDEELHEQRVELRAPYRPRGERARGRDREGEKARKEALKEKMKARELAWRKEDLLNALNLPLMRAMDMLVRETEEARALAEEDESSVQQVQSEEPKSQPVSKGSHPNDEIPVPMDLDEELIDPSLRDSSSAPTRVHTPRLEDDPLPRTPVHPVSNIHDNFNPVTPPFTHLRPDASSSTLAVPEQDALSTADSASAAAPDMTTLSPAARRRLRKRMYMRRKRAEANGGEVNQSTSRLQPGRKKLKLPRETEDVNEPTRHPRFSGKTLTYKMREQLDAAGITSEWMQEESLDLFHMTGLHKLMRMYNELHDVFDSVVTEISLHAVKRLRDELVRFLVQLVQRTIISREQEIRAKMNTKVWRLAKNQVITGANVAHALSIMGQQHANKKPLFEQLLHKLGLTEEDFAESDEEVPIVPQKSSKGKQRAQTSPTGVESEDGMDVDTQTSVNPILQSASVHRVIFPPFVRLPGASPNLDSSQSLLSHIPWASGLSTGDTEGADDDDKSDESDDEQLEQQWQEEDLLDVKDGKVDKRCEYELWRSFGIVTEEVAAVKRMGTGDYDGPRLRKRRKVVKTTEFVPDSDEE